MRFFPMIFGKIFLGNILFGKICTFDTECKYKSICSSYKYDSYTVNMKRIRVTVEIIGCFHKKSGIFYQFEDNKIRKNAKLSVILT
jgi:hypothetical protein